MALKLVLALGGPDREDVYKRQKQMSGVGYQPPRDDGEFHQDTRFDGGPSDWDPER